MEFYMVQLQITVPETLKDWVEATAQAGGYIDASDYVRDLIRRDQETRDALIDALEDGLASGVSDRTLDDIWVAAKARVAHG